MRSTTPEHHIGFGNDTHLNPNLHQNGDGNGDIGWIDAFRSQDPRHQAYWFWCHFTPKEQSLWIGQLRNPYQLPPDELNRIDYMKTMITRMRIKYPNIYLKLYYTTNYRTQEPEMNYLMIYNHSDVFSNSTDSIDIDDAFERYEITQELLNERPDFKDMISHYLNWNNYFGASELIHTEIL
jgi:hypothetical protein